MSNHYGMKMIDGHMSLFSLSPAGHIKNTKGPQRSNVLKILFLVGVMVSTCHGSLYFKIDNQNSSTTSLICSYGDGTVGQYFDVFRNGRQCLTAALGTCAPVVNQGCHCEEDMAQNEVWFTIESPRYHDKCTLKCKLLGEVSEEKTIIVMPEGTKPPNVYSSQPQPIAIQLTTEPSMTLREADGKLESGVAITGTASNVMSPDEKPERGAASTVTTFKILFGLSMLVNVILSGFVWRNRKWLYRYSANMYVCPV